SLAKLSPTQAGSGLVSTTSLALQTGTKAAFAAGGANVAANVFGAAAFWGAALTACRATGAAITTPSALPNPIFLHMLPLSRGWPQVQANHIALAPASPAGPGPTGKPIFPN